MKQFLLASALILGAAGLFFGGRAVLMPEAVAVAAASASGPVLGDLSAMIAIVDDVSALASGGDLAGAKARITDLETAWDAAEPAMRPLDPEAWRRVDDATDAALAALRAAAPDAATVGAALTALRVVMDNPGGGQATAGEVGMVAGKAVTDAAGHPIPCEAMLAEVKDKLAATPPKPADQAKLDDLVARATERCNADDDRRADEFSAQALSLLSAR